MDRPDTQNVNSCSLIISEISPKCGLVCLFQQPPLGLYRPGVLALFVFWHLF